MNLKTVALATTVAALSLSTGCTVLGGALMGGNMWGTGSIMGQGNISALNGSSVVCLGTTAENVESDGEHRIQGRIVDSTWDNVVPGFDNLVPCWSDVQTTIKIEDESGDIWTVGYAWLDGGGWDMTPMVYESNGTAVDLLVRHQDGTEAAGFVVSKPNGDLVYAMEAGRDTQALQDGDVPGISIATAGSVGHFDDDCGSKNMMALRFASDSDEVTLDPGDDIGLEADGNYYTTCSIESFEYEEGGGCDDDISSEVSWVLFR